MIQSKFKPLPRRVTMGSTYPEISDDLAKWIKRQKMFFVATAPLSGAGLLNCSPKGGDTFAIVNGTTAAYLDLTGSGAETIAHLRENGRLVIMFCAFDGAPLIVRLHGRGEVILADHPDYQSLVSLFPPNPGVRSVIRLIISRISDSCGMAVPQYTFQDHRTDLDEWAESKGPEKLTEYRIKKNTRSIEGLPAIDF
jgi:hypothetical protein